MAAAVRDLGVAINWRITLLGLNLAAWLVGALLLAALLVHHEMASPPLYPGFGYSLPMFNDVPVLYPARIDSQPVGLKGIGALKAAPAAHPGSSALAQHPAQLGAPRRLSSAEQAQVNAPSRRAQPSRP